MSHKFSSLGKILDRDNYAWLVANNEDIAAAIETEVQAGAEPESIGRYMVAVIGAERQAFINRCVSAARWLQSSRG